jgi:hypothetical protein
MNLAARRFAFLSIVPLLAALACGGETPVAMKSTARLQILMEGREVTGLSITTVPSGFPRFTAAALDASGAPSATYGPSALSASNPAAVRIDGDGSLVLLSLGTSHIIATARALSPSQNPQVLRDSVTISIVCTAEMLAGLNVVVRDSVTGTPAAVGATLRAISGTWRDSVVVPASWVGYVGWATAWERAGTYTVTVDRDGYLPWRRDSIVVPRDLCHVIGQRVDVNLVPR